MMANETHGEALRCTLALRSLLWCATLGFGDMPELAPMCDLICGVRPKVSPKRLENMPI